jgi:predicted Zn finger-like uncharacterized protein
MNIICTECRTRYSIADSLIPPQGARFKCRKCGNVIPVAAPTVELAPRELETIPPARPSPPPALADPPQLETIRHEETAEHGPEPIARGPEPIARGPEPIAPAEAEPESLVAPKSHAPAPPPDPAFRQGFEMDMAHAAPAATEPEPEPPAHDPEPSLAPRLEVPETTPPLEGPETPSRFGSPPSFAEPAIPVSAPAPRAPATPPGIPGAQAPAPSPVPPGGGTPVPDGLSPEDRAKHEKARRLARVLASDIAIYNREKRERGIKEGNLVAVLGYEIKKSWEIYKERVSPEFANATPYFRDALNEMLAEGKKIF